MSHLVHHEQVAFVEHHHQGHAALFHERRQQSVQCLPGRAACEGGVRPSTPPTQKEAAWTGLW
jgi:hypothetical protein